MFRNEWFIQVQLQLQAFGNLACPLPWDNDVAYKAVPKDASR